MTLFAAIIEQHQPVTNIQDAKKKSECLTLIQLFPTGTRISIEMVSDVSTKVESVHQGSVPRIWTGCKHWGRRSLWLDECDPTKVPTTNTKSLNPTFVPEFYSGCGVSMQDQG